MLSTNTPATLDDRVAACENFKTTAGERRALASYSHVWTFRAAMIAERAALGFKELGFSDKNTTDDISKAFPDQCEWVRYFSPGGPVPVGEFLRQVGYTDSIEYLTCDLCILMPVAEQLSEPGTAKGRAAMDEELKIQGAGHQVHPAVATQQLKRGADGSLS